MVIPLMFHSVLDVIFIDFVCFCAENLSVSAETANSTGFCKTLTSAVALPPDYSKLNETGGAYGSSSNTTSTKALTSLEGFGSVTNHMLQQSEKENGKVIPLKHEYYLVANGSVYPAQKKLFEKMLPSDKQAALKGFLKENKIRWNKPEDLLKLVAFIED